MSHVFCFSDVDESKFYYKHRFLFINVGLYERDQIKRAQIKRDQIKRVIPRILKMYFNRNV